MPTSDPLPETTPTPEPAAGVPPGDARPALLGLATGVLAALLHFLRYGYAYGSGAHDRYLPVVLKRLDPQLYSGDWLVTQEATTSGLLNPFLIMLEGLGRLVPLWSVVLFLHVASIVALGAGVFLLARTLVRSDVAAAASSLAAIVLTSDWTLGESAFAENLLLPDTLSWMLTIWALVAHLNHRHILSGLAMGLAALLHPLSALFPTTLLFIHLLSRGGIGWRVRLHTLLTTLMGFLLTAMPLLIRLPIGPNAMRVDGEAYPPLFYILAEFRFPTTYLPDAFPIADLARFGALLVAGVVGYLWLRRRKELNHSDFLFTGLNVLVAFLVLAYHFTSTTPLLQIAQLEPFRATVLAMPFLVCGIWGGVLCVSNFVLRARAWLQARVGLLSRIAVVTAAVVLLVISISERALLNLIHPLAHQRTELGVVEQWTARATDTRATFLVPPSLTSFRSSARRGIVINFSSPPSHVGHARTWFQRLLSIAPLPLPEHERPADTVVALDAAYAEQSPARLSALALQYGADFVLLNRSVSAPERLLEVFSSGEWHVYLPVETPGPRLTQIERGAAHDH